MVVRERARSEAAKAARAGEILEAFRALVEEASFGEVTVAEVAQRARLSKGTVFNYFATKEAMGVALVERQLMSWLSRLDDTLSGLGAPASPVVVARVVVETLREAPLLVSLMSILGTVLERNLDAATVRGFKLRVLERATVTAGELERVLPFLGEGGGLELLLVLDALIIGLHQMAGPAPVVRKVLSEPALAPLRVDVDVVLERALRLHLEGLRQAPRGGAGSRDER